jgi:hypothetical protein
MQGTTKRRMLFLAGAVAAYAWRSRSRARRSAGGESERSGAASGTGDSGMRRAAADGHDAVGITDLPSGAEEAQQSSLPPRGERKPGVHA